jgi:hypothetical protein
MPRLFALLRDLGISISKRQIVRLLNEGHGAFLNEACEVLRAGLGSAPPVPWWIGGHKQRRPGRDDQR